MSRVRPCSCISTAFAFLLLQSIIDLIAGNIQGQTLHVHHSTFINNHIVFVFVKTETILLLQLISPCRQSQLHYRKTGPWSPHHSLSFQWETWLTNHTQTWILGRISSVCEIGISPDHGPNIVSTQCVIEVKADAIVVVKHQVIPLHLLHLLLIVVLTFHMVCCVHSRWVKASVQCFYFFAHRSHAGLLIRQRSPLVYFPSFEHNRTSVTFSHISQNRQIMQSLNNCSEYCVTTHKTLKKWPICFPDSARSISCVRLETASSSGSASSTISVSLHHLDCPTPHNLFSTISTGYFCHGRFHLRLFGQYFLRPRLTLMDAAILQILTSGKERLSDDDCGIIVMKSDFVVVLFKSIFATRGISI